MNTYFYYLKQQSYPQKVAKSLLILVSVLCSPEARGEAHDYCLCVINNTEKIYTQSLFSGQKTYIPKVHLETWDFHREKALKPKHEMVCGWSASTYDIRLSFPHSPKWNVKVTPVQANCSTKFKSRVELSCKTAHGGGQILLTAHHYDNKTKSWTTTDITPWQDPSVWYYSHHFKKAEASLLCK